MDEETYCLLMSATKSLNNLATAIKLYYTLKSKPAEQLTAHEKVHLDNMEAYATWKSIDL
jgi:DNA-binding SARP family transcriptional activator